MNRKRPRHWVTDQDVGGHAASENSVNKWPSLVHAIENELCRLNDIVDHEGLARASHCGRGESVRTIYRLSLPQKTSAALGKVCIYAHALLWLSRRLRELADISAKVSAGQPITSGALDQWSRLMAKVAAPTGLPMIVEKIGAPWPDHMEAVRCHMPGRGTSVLRDILRAAAEAAADIKTHNLEKRASTLWDFAEKQVASGASVAHRLVKRGSVLVCDTTAVVVGSRRTTSPQDILDLDLQAWRVIRTHLGDALTAPWKEDKVTSALEPIMAHDSAEGSSHISHGHQCGL